MHELFVLYSFWSRPTYFVSFHHGYFVLDCILCLYSLIYFGRYVLRTITLCVVCLVLLCVPVPFPVLVTYYPGRISVVVCFGTCSPMLPCLRGRGPIIPIFYPPMGGPATESAQRGQLTLQVSTASARQDQALPQVSTASDQQDQALPKVSTYSVQLVRLVKKKGLLGPELGAYFCLKKGGGLSTDLPAKVSPPPSETLT
jgi:hypothetical protein